MADKMPLWDVMREAAKATPLVSGIIGGGLGYVKRSEAARLRALADVVVPVRQEPIEVGSAYWVQWAERQRIRNLLLAEAERAEKGDANG